MEGELVLLFNMNINVEFKIPFIEGDDFLVLTENFMLKPFYVTENELLSIYLTKYTEEQYSLAREVIFYSSIKADSIVGKILDDLTPEEQFAFKRELTLCLATVSFGNKFNVDFIKSLSRSKSLAEFSVSTTSTNDPQFVMNIINDAKECVETLKSALNTTSSNLIRTFVKGANNCKNNTSNRLWHHFELPHKSKETHASQKKSYGGKYYKNGGRFY